MAKCQFTAKYYDYERLAEADYKCHDDEESVGSGRCMFHDEKYLQDKNNQKEQKVRDRLMSKVDYSIDQSQALFCIGYHVPDIEIKANFAAPVYFSKCEFQGRVDLYGASFQGTGDFGFGTFSGEAVV